MVGSLGGDASLVVGVVTMRVVTTSALTRSLVIPNSCYYLADASYNSSQ
jgi:hypothetical protein